MYFKTKLTSENLTLSDKREFYFVDLFRLICAFMVVAIHTDPFGEINTQFSDIFEGTILRIAVPFFFTASGYFVAKRLNGGIIKYIKRLFIMSLIYTFIYRPTIIFKIFEGNILKNILIFIYEIFFVGTYVHLWYFPALITSVIILWFLVNKLKLNNKVLLTVSIVLYVSGTLIANYDFFNQLVLKVPLLSGLLSKLGERFTRNGFFFGFPFVCLGYLINVSKLTINKKQAGAFAIFFLLLMFAEQFINNEIKHLAGGLILMLYPLSFNLFVFILNVNMPANFKSFALFSRKASVIIYGLHMLIYNTLKGCFTIPNLECYIIVLVLNLIVSYIVIKLSSFKMFKWLKYIF